MSRVARIDRMRRFALLLLIAACSSPRAPEAPPKIVPSTANPSLRQSPTPIVDSHVHLAYYPVADQLASHGIGAAVDLASPESALGTKYPIPVIQAGPMLTRPNGYPLDAWGSNGYGIGCDDGRCVARAIERLHNEGARVIKIALDNDGLDERLALGAALLAHRLGMKVAVHALTDESVRLAARIHADVLAHTPIEPLSELTINAWKLEARSSKPIDGMPYQQEHDHAVISTLAAFGGSPIAINNLRALRGAGLLVLYGTDLGNLRVDGPSSEEMEFMKSAGMTDDEVRESMTTVPWHFWGFDAIEPR